ncbi:MAG: hypothetical protein CL609_17920 [Anaerolineaceae bacterium]|nr:hypothetical protein [Anaerolineaceae bacterium]
MIKKQALFLLILMLTVACNVPTQEVQTEQLPTVPLAVIPSDTAVPPTPTITPVPPFSPDVDSGNVMYDFTAQYCSAKWGNNGEFFDCPINDLETKSGVVQKLDDAKLEGGIPINAPTLLTIPGYDQLMGIFGRYPAYQVQSGDHFMAHLACLPDGGECHVEFALEYYRQDGTYVSLPFSDIELNSSNGFDLMPVDIDLSSLSDQSVDFVLVVRNIVDEPPGYPVWIYPHITRKTP